MKLRRLLQLGLASLLGVSSLLVISVPSAFAAGPFTCTWTGATNNNFSTAGNWSGCNSAAPQPGDNDNLVFSATSLTQDTTLDNDISGLNLGTITFSGTNGSNFSYILSGDAINLAGGITDTSAVSGTLLPHIELGVTLTASQTFSLTTSDVLNVDSVNIGSNNLTLSTATGEIFLGSIAGSGQLSTDVSQATGSYEVIGASSSFTGPTVVNAGDMAIGDPGALGSGAVTVAGGATLTSIFESQNATLANPLTIDGDGVVAGINLGALNFNNDCSSNIDNTSCANDGTVTVSGPVTLTGNSTVGTDATANFTGAVSNGFTLTLQSGFTGTLQFAGSSSGAGSSAGSAAPKTPDTGLALIAAHPLQTFALSVVAAFTILIVARRLRPIKH